jgi:hypothetical protein
MATVRYHHNPDTFGGCTENSSNLIVFDSPLRRDVVGTPRLIGFIGLIATVVWNKSPVT